MSEENKAPPGKPEEQSKDGDVKQRRPDYRFYMMVDFGAFLKKFILLLASLLIDLVKGRTDPDRVLRSIKRLNRKEDPDLRAARVAARCAGGTESLAAIYYVTGELRDLHAMMARAKSSQADWNPVVSALNRCGRNRLLTQYLHHLLNVRPQMYLLKTAPKATDDLIAMAWEEATSESGTRERLEAMTDVYELTRLPEQIECIVRQVLYMSSDSSVYPYAQLCHVRTAITAQEFRSAEQILLSIQSDKLQNPRVLIDLALTLVERSLDSAFVQTARAMIQAHAAGDVSTRKDYVGKLRVLEVHIAVRNKEYDRADALAQCAELPYYRFRCRCAIAYGKFPPSVETPDFESVKTALESVCASEDPYIRTWSDQAHLEFVRLALYFSTARGGSTRREIVKSMRPYAGKIASPVIASQAYLGMYSNILSLERESKTPCIHERQAGGPCVNAGIEILHVP